MEETYLLIKWPESQELMEYPWFQDECFLAVGKEDITGSSAYFVPQSRINEL